MSKDPQGRETAKAEAAQLLSLVVAQMKSLSSHLRGVSKSAADTNNTLINELLLADDAAAIPLARSILTQLLHIADLKGVNPFLLAILTKIIFFLKLIDQPLIGKHQENFPLSPERKGASANIQLQNGVPDRADSDIKAEDIKEEDIKADLGNKKSLSKGSRSSISIGDMLYHVIDILFVLKNKQKQPEMMLRIVQTTFSLIDLQMLRHVDFSLITRLYSICFQFCLGDSIIQNISVSALCSLTEIFFLNGTSMDAEAILTQLLQYLFRGRKFSWLKDNELKGVVWELIILAIRHYPASKAQKLSGETVELLTEMYTTSCQKAFTAQVVLDGKMKKGEQDRSINFKRGSMPDFIRYYKAYVYFSIHLALRLKGEKVPFRETMVAYKAVADMDRNQRTYLLLQGLGLILQNSHTLLIEGEAMVMLEVLTKFSEELCLMRRKEEILWKGTDLYLDKMCGDFSKISDSDYIRLISNTIVTLRRLFQQTPHLNLPVCDFPHDSAQVSVATYSSTGTISYRNPANSLADPPNSDLPRDSSKTIGQGEEYYTRRRRWETLIKHVICIVRYLTSIETTESASEQPIRKLLMELQHWFLICKNNKTRNLIASELFVTSTLLNTRLQAIKASQCVQIGSNIIYGYYDVLDSVGLAYLLKMMSGIKVDFEDGRGFEQLDQVFTLLEKLYSEQRLIHSEESFSKTIHAFVHCANGLIADVGKPQHKNDRNLRMIDYLLSKLAVVIEQNTEFAGREWNLLTCFWISFCSSKCHEVRERTLAHLAFILSHLLARPNHMSQQNSLLVYIELSNTGIPLIEREIVKSLRQMVVFLKSEQAIVEVFRVLRNIYEKKEYQKAPFCQLGELQQMLIKEALFNVKRLQNLRYIIQSISVTSESKTEEYRVINLLWGLSDHLRSLPPGEHEDLWIQLFNRLLHLAYTSLQTETKQSCIHTFTQILAESFGVLSRTTLTEIMETVYVKVFLMMLGMETCDRGVVQTEQRVEMMRIGVKNYLKIMRKLLSIEEKIGEFIAQGCTAKIVGFMTIQKQMGIEYYFELLLLVQQLQSLPHRATQSKLIQELFIQLESKVEGFDKTGLLWRKKYEPLYMELKGVFAAAL